MAAGICYAGDKNPEERVLAVVCKHAPKIPKTLCGYGARSSGFGLCGVHHRRAAVEKASRSLAVQRHKKQHADRTRIYKPSCKDTNARLQPQHPSRRAVMQLRYGRYLPGEARVEGALSISSMARRLYTEVSSLVAYC